MSKDKIGIIGIGYVGLPLALKFAQYYPTFAFDISKNRVDELKNGFDRSGYINKENLLHSLQDHQQGHPLRISNEIADIETCNYFIITVPTPTDQDNRPILTYLEEASSMLAPLLKQDDVVIYESTVYPGVTEEVCIPLLEKESGLKFNKDFFVGYSPERINPGDTIHTIENIIKITSGSTPAVAQKVDDLYNTIIKAGTYLAPSIKVAEAAKVIENSQRDINIAFMNELAQIFSRLNIDTREVLKAAETKWNFLPFKPGLVGGHCISVDPYYLVKKANDIGYQPELIVAGRKLNNGMAKWVASEVIKLMIQKGALIKGGRILCLGITFKENCSSITNSKAIDVINEFKEYGAQVDIYDPVAHKDEVAQQFRIDLIDQLNNAKYNAIVLLVAHHQFKTLDMDSLKLNQQSVIYDIQGILPKEAIDGRL